MMGMVDDHGNRAIGVWLGFRCEPVHRGSAILEHQTGCTSDSNAVVG
jgi:hypothetical protein